MTTTFTSLFDKIVSKFDTTKVRSGVRAAVAAAVGSAVAYATTKWGSLHVGQFALLAPAVTAVYYAGVNWLEKKVPQLGWLLGILPQPKPKAKTLVK